ncbi:MAG TPA: uroporphyrinogen-III synthase [Methanocella sp.]|uniref:uroporphyrinogen-III synthase n=1 Tax=Methanocella sp. TaxID=2052833 RepID=UPI002B5D7196|nr:uroporphyrinogen-III synthase [Methanocella sp.]HTY90544.1 uroporphyrinogen-III synthase [Methanocella sp.]
MKRVAVTRPAKFLPAAAEYLRLKGMEAVPVPMMELVPRKDGDIDAFLERLSAGQVDVMVLTSQNGFLFLLERLGDDVEHFLGLIDGVRVLAIGPKTKKALEEHAIWASLVPSTYSSEGIVKEFSFPRKHVEVLRSDHGNPALIKGLEDGGAVVHETVLYDIVPLDGEEQEAFVREVLAGRIDAFTFTSTMTAKSLFLKAQSMGVLSELKRAINAKKVAVIGNPTAQYLAGNGIRVDVVPERFTFEDMIDALAKAL